jgi:hypothetical protein
MKKPEGTDPRRRQFLHTAKGAGLLGAAFALMSRAAPAAATPVEETRAEEAPQENRGYHETEHVRNYYDALRRM